MKSLIKRESTVSWMEMKKIKAAIRKKGCILKVPLTKEKEEAHVKTCMVGIFM